MPPETFKLERWSAVIVDLQNILQVGEADGCQLLKNTLSGDIKNLVGNLRDPITQFHYPCGNLGVL